MAKTRRVAVAIDLGTALRHHQDVFAGIERYAQERTHWDCIVQPFVRNLQKCRGKTGYHGIIARVTAGLAQEAATAGVHLVNVWSGSPATTLPSVLPDFEASGRMAAEHLLGRGFRRFAFQEFSRHGGTQLALAGFKDTLLAAKCRPTTMTLSSRCDEDARSWEQYSTRMERWIGGWKLPLGVFVVQDIFCRYLAYACLRAGLRIPEDVALIGFGNEPTVCVHPEPSLSSIEVGFERVGYEAAALLDRLMDGRPAPKAPILVQPAGLVVRRSTDVYVVDDPEVAAALRFIAEHSPRRHPRGRRGEARPCHRAVAEAPFPRRDRPHHGGRDRAAATGTRQAAAGRERRTDQVCGARLRLYQCHLLPHSVSQSRRDLAGRVPTAAEVVSTAEGTFCDSARFRRLADRPTPVSQKSTVIPRSCRQFR